MSTNRTLQSLALLAAIMLSPAVGNAIEVAPEPVRVFVVDDQTGEELRTKHGIQPLQVDDLIELLNAAIMGDTPVQIFHRAVDEEASDNVLAQLVFNPFSGTPKPTMPQGSIPVHQFAMIKKAFDQRRAEWQREIRAYQREVVESTRSFVLRVGTTQIEVAQRFDRILEARHGADFNRSDIVGSVAAANRILGSSGRRILVLNTDAEDLPGNRKPRRLPLTTGELDPGIELLFVNTSRIPEQSILFAGIPNPVHHADSMKEAMRYIADVVVKTDANQGPALAGE